MVKLNKEKIFLLVLFTISLFLTFKGLGFYPLWQDEANAALLGKCILTHGIPKVILGENYISCLSADVRYDYVWRLWGWIPLYLNALIYWLKGTSTFWARFPYALMGAFFPLLVYKKTLSINRYLAVSYSIFTAFSYVLLLHFRQCQYYAPAIIVTFLLFMLGYQGDLHKKNKAFQFIIYSFILFQVHFLGWFLALAGITAALLLTNYKLFFRNILTFIIAGAVNIPAFIYFRIPEIRGVHSAKATFSFRLLFTEWQNFMQRLFIPFMNMYIWGLTLIIALLFLIYKKKLLKAQRIIFCFVFIITYSLLLSHLAKITYYRYFIPLIPVMAFTFYLSLSSIFLKQRIHNIIILMVTIFLSINLINAGNTNKSLTLSYITSLFHDGKDVNEVIIDYLKKNSENGETLLTNYGSFPIIYYTALNVGGGFSGYRYQGIKHIYPHTPIEKPDWLIIRNDWPNGKGNLADILNKWNYKKISFAVRDTAWGNRPSPYYHFFATPEGDPELAIYKLLDKN